MANRSFSFTFKADEQLRRSLKALPYEMRRSIGRKSVNRGAKRLVEAVKDTMRAMDVHRTGAGIESIGHATRLDKLYKDELTAEVGPVSPMGWYLHFIEFGTGPRQTSDGRSTGFVPPKPFMETAFNQTIGEVQTLIGETLRVEIAKVA